MLSRLLGAVLIVVGLAAGAGRAADPAPNVPFKPGDPVEYRQSGSPDKYEVGTFLKLLPGGTQALVREKPNQFFKEGFERAYNLDALRAVGAGKKKPEAPAAQPGGTDPKTAPKPPQPLAAAGPPLSEPELLGFLRQRLGDNPFANPDRDRVKLELAELVKKRGVNFHYQAVSPFSNELSKFGATSDITFPISANYGPPTLASFYPGGWNMVIIGAPFDFVRNGKLFRQTEIGAKAGFLTINPNGTYVWKLYAGDPPSKHVQGKWRAATPTEMKHEGGAGLVLLKAKSGWDWIVTRDRATTVKGEWISVSELNTRQVREFGAR